MAIYRKTNIKDENTVWCLVSPTNIFEALKISWLLLRHQDRFAVLAGVTQSFLEENCKKVVAYEERTIFDNITEAVASE